jgi:Kdo2-lipid IVA lauroyltransferase/acyltransferase
MPFFLALIARLPLPVAHLLGALLGPFLLLSQPRMRERMADNLRQAGLSKPFMGLGIAAELGKLMLETPVLWHRPLDTITGWVREVQGWEHVEAAQAQGKGLLIITPHLGCWELAGMYYGARLPLTALYQPPEKPWLERLMRAGRERGFLRTVPTTTRGVRQLLETLRASEAVLILPDQGAREGQGVWVDFFGRQAYKPALPYKLAQATGAAPLLFVCERLSWGRGYRLWIDPVPPLPETLEGAAQVVNDRMENWVRRFPRQFLWTYPYYRTRKARKKKPRTEEASP